MTFVREAIVSMRAATQLLPRAAAKLPERSESAKAIDILGAADAAAAQPIQGVLDAVVARLIAAFVRPGSVTPTRNDLRDAPWVLWVEPSRLVNLPGLLDAVWTQATRSNATRRNLIEAWLRNFSPDGLGIAEGGAAIRRLIVSNLNPRFDLWRKADQRLELFDHRRGPRNLALWLLQGPESVHAILRAMSFDDPLRAVGGYMRFVQSETLALAANHLRAQSGQEALTRLKSFLAPNDALRFAEPQSHGEIARGLLAPWLDGEREPIDSVRDGVRTFLLRNLADPRIRPEKWRPVGKEATNLMRRWLARASLKAFFELIADHALDAHWKYREAFWSACLNQGGIDDAWLALGSRVHADASAVRELDGAYARLEGASDQSILLLKVKNTIFCEWSHMGKLRAWPDDWKSAPRLNQSSYSRKDVMQNGLPFPRNLHFGSNGSADGAGLSHFGSDRSYWQGSAAELLARRAGINLAPSDWMPR